MLNETNRSRVQTELAMAKEAKRGFLDRIAATDVTEIGADIDLARFAIAGARTAFVENCGGCHGTGGAGGPGYPNLLDDDWLWGGDVATIHETLLVGIRSGHEDTRDSQMPAFLTDELLERSEIDDVVQYVLSLRGNAADGAAAARGATLFEENCSSCHGEDAGGDQDMGAPNLTDAIWLYGGDEESITETVMYSRYGVMPAWQGRLEEETIKMLAVYVHALGGGQ